MSAKRIRLFLLACAYFFAATGPVRAQTTETLQLFDQGNRHYEAGEYSKAAAAYEEALDTGVHSAALHYNLGNAYYRLDELGRAILNYERARLLDPDNRAVVHSLELARTRTMDRFSKLPDPVWTTAWRRVVAVVSLSGILWTGMILYLLGFGLLIFRILASRRDAWLRRTVLVLLGIGVPLVAVSLLSSRAAQLRPRCVVLERAVSVRPDPDPAANAELEIHEGLVVHTVEADSSWLKVRLPNGVTGWVEKSTVEKI